MKVWSCWQPELSAQPQSLYGHHCVTAESELSDRCSQLCHRRPRDGWCINVRKSPWLVRMKREPCVCILPHFPWAQSKNPSTSHPAHPLCGGAPHCPSPQHRRPMGLLPLCPSVGSDPTHHSKWKREGGTTAVVLCRAEVHLNPETSCVWVLNHQAAKRCAQKHCALLHPKSTPPRALQPCRRTHPYVRLSTKRTSAWRDTKDLRNKKLIII